MCEVQVQKTPSKAILIRGRLIGALTSPEPEVRAGERLAASSESTRHLGPVNMIAMDESTAPQERADCAEQWRLRGRTNCSELSRPTAARCVAASVVFDPRKPDFSNPLDVVPLAAQSTQTICPRQALNCEAVRE